MCMSMMIKYLHVHDDQLGFVDPDGRAAQALACFGVPIACGVAVGATIAAVYFSTPAGQETASEMADAVLTGRQYNESSESDSEGTDRSTMYWRMRNRAKRQREGRPTGTKRAPPMMQTRTLIVLWIPILL